MRKNVKRILVASAALLIGPPAALLGSASYVTFGGPLDRAEAAGTACLAERGLPGAEMRHNYGPWMTTAGDLTYSVRLSRPHMGGIDYYGYPYFGEGDLYLAGQEAAPGVDGFHSHHRPYADDQNAAEVDAALDEERAFFEATDAKLDAAFDDCSQTANDAFNPIDRAALLTWAASKAVVHPVTGLFLNR
ncbi:MAG: hypothetical protein AB7G06_08275 [Bdellovibrionales bacterium]